MEDMTRLPNITLLTLDVMTKGHSFAASLFHILRMCTGVRKLALVFLGKPSNLEVKVRIKIQGGTYRPRQRK
uniref:FBD domain-containing protein n=1 Tax=Aegilops tauschii subsp. strangulata TaxID=200361 RepID=A0A453C453_AEGTS